jgi:hypothetical protein
MAIHVSPSKSKQASTQFLDGQGGGKPALGHRRESNEAAN